MIQKLRGSNEKGFTLIELMIVIAIIGILAAIAIPNFVSYRQRSYNSAAQSDLKNAMTAQEAYFVDEQTYYGTAGNKTLTTGSALTGWVKSTNVDTVVVAASTGGYTMSAAHSAGNVTWTVKGPGGAMASVK